MKNKYIIGIDTGGTYTDGVLFDIASKDIIATAKRETSHHNLAHSTGDVLHRLIAENNITPEQIAKIGLSSTLATNSVVEKKGARVAIIVIGYVKHFKLPVHAVVFVKGGHNIKGEEEQELELDYLVTLLDGLKDEVDAFAVCSAMSMANPSHELVTEKAISLIAPKPVFSSHRISQQAGMEQRAATAGLHAKLMPVMEDFVSGVTQAMEEHKLECPVLIISGNGKPIKKQFAIENAGTTVASGPCCTAHFGASNTSEDCLVVDIGGTTTDITMLKNGSPIITKEGCTIGDWKTRVEAVDMLTGAIGGDSHVKVDSHGHIIIGPSRVTPLIKAGNIPDISSWLGIEDHAKCIQLLKETSLHPEITARLIQNGPMTPAQLKQETGLSGIPLEKRLETLTREQLIKETGFTPTDGLHVLDKLQIGDKQKAIEGAEILANAANMSVEKFCVSVIEKTEKMIEDLIIDYVVRLNWGKSLTAFINSRNDHPVLGIDFSLKVPIIGVGAAASLFLPRVAERLNTPITFPKHCEVGNAAGAALLCSRSTEY